MGFDLYGRASNGEETYFRNNCWWWRPLWDYVCEVCDLGDDAQKRGAYNDGYEISGQKAQEMATILTREVESGRTAFYAQQREHRLNVMADIGCDICHGTGKRDDAYVKGECNSCRGKGTVRPWETNYPFSVENVKEFIAFLEISGKGFQIW